MTATAVLDSKAQVLAGARAARRAEMEATAAQLRFAVAWADQHPAESVLDAAAMEVFGETVIPIAGPGAPLVAEFCVAELAAALGMPTDHGRWLLGEAIELRHRLPRVWGRVMRLELPAWRARRIARQTIELSAVATSFVDRQVAHVAHRVGPVVVERLVEEAVARFMPATARERREQAADQRRFVVDHRQVTFAGTSKVYGELDLADALDLDAAVTARAAQLKALGATEGLDARRAAAVGEIARADLMLELHTLAAATGTEPSADEPAAAPRRRGSRETVLYVHLSHDALTALTAGPHGPDGPDGPDGRGVVGRLENTGDLVTADQIRDWCAAPFARVVVKPVLDLDEHIHVGSYEVPDRLAEQVNLRDGSCVFPWCTRPARGCDHDHVTPHSQDGTTCSCNLAPLCRRHHRLKTHAVGWTYTALDPGTYLWASPHGYRFHRDHTGTRDVTHDPPPRPD